MKKLLSCLLVLALFLTLSFTGGWAGIALAEAPEELVGTYELVEMVMEGVDYSDQLKTSGISFSLVVNADGTAVLDTGDETLELVWTEKGFAGDDGVAVPYSFEDGLLTLKEDDMLMSFRKVESGAQKLPEGEQEGIAGFWIGSVDMLDMLVKEDPDLAKYMDSALVSVALEMRKDGTYTMSLDGTPMLASMKIAMYGYVEDLCKENEITVEDLEKSYGKSLDEIIDEGIAENLSELTATEEGVWEENGGQVIWKADGNETRGRFTGDTLIYIEQTFGEIELTRGGIVGLWVAPVDLGSIEGEDGDSQDFMQNVSFNLVLDFRSDNSLLLYIDKESMLPSLKAGMKALFEETLAENNMSVEAAEAAYGMSLDEIIDSLLEEMDFSELDVQARGSFSEKDGEILVKFEDGSEQQGTWSGSSLSIEVEEFGTLEFSHVSTEDVLAKGEGAMTYAEYIAAEQDSPVVIEAYVQAHQDWRDKAVSVYAQDGEGAYFIYKMACSEEEAKQLVPGQKIRVTGVKSEWSGEVEIVDASFELVKGSFLFIPADLTELLGTEKLIEHQNQFISLKGLTVAESEGGAAWLYGWDGSGEEGDDLYFKVELDGKEYSFLVESDLCGPGTAVYESVKNLEVGDTINLEGFLYWYEQPNVHVTSVVLK